MDAKNSFEIIFKQLNKEYDNLNNLMGSLYLKIQQNNDEMDINLLENIIETVAILNLNTQKKLIEIHSEEFNHEYDYLITRISEKKEVLNNILEEIKTRQR